MGGIQSMASTTITHEGQITIPKEIWDYLKLATGSKVDFVIDHEGQVKMIPLMRGKLEPGRNSQGVKNAIGKG